MRVCAGCNNSLEGTHLRRKWCLEHCRKRQYDKACKDCGARINGTTPSKCGGRCAPCDRKRRAPETRARHIAAICKWAALYGEAPASVDWSPHQARYYLHDEARARRWEEGAWPSKSAVIHAFGSWNAGIEAAGFKSRAKYGGAGNQLRRRSAA